MSELQRRQESDVYSGTSHTNTKMKNTALQVDENRKINITCNIPLDKITKFSSFGQFFFISLLYCQKKRKKPTQKERCQRYFIYVEFSTKN
jgi:hypothetical protein